MTRLCLDRDKGVCNILSQKPQNVAAVELGSFGDISLLQHSDSTTVLERFKAGSTGRLSVYRLSLELALELSLELFLELCHFQDCARHSV